jgi:ribosomal protein S18 acetylase RimI-like enzyme
MNITIRKAKQSDAESILSLWKEMMDFHRKYDKYYSRSESTSKKYRKIVSENISSKKSLVLVAVYNKNIVGYTIASIVKYPLVLQLKQFGTVYELAVQKKLQRNGIGEQLFMETQKWFKKHSLKRIELSVLRKNPISSKFWKKMGFEPFLERWRFEF